MTNKNLSITCTKNNMSVEQIIKTRIIKYEIAVDKKEKDLIIQSLSISNNLDHCRITINREKLTDELLGPTLKILDHIKLKPSLKTMDPDTFGLTSDFLDDKSILALSTTSKTQKNNLEATKHKRFRQAAIFNKITLFSIKEYLEPTKGITLNKSGSIEKSNESIHQLAWNIGVCRAGTLYDILSDDNIDDKIKMLSILEILERPNSGKTLKEKIKKNLASMAGQPFIDLLVKFSTPYNETVHQTQASRLINRAVNLPSMFTNDHAEDIGNYDKKEDFIASNFQETIMNTNAKSTGEKSRCILS